MTDRIRKILTYLRIVWTAFFGLVSVLLMLLWVRSYWRVEHILWNSKTESYCVSTCQGKVTIESRDDGVLMPLGWSRACFSISDDDLISEAEPRTILGFGWQTGVGLITAIIPFWFLVLTCTAFIWFAIVPPHMVCRFSLRTLLIAITLVAMVLGLVVFNAM